MTTEADTCRTYVLPRLYDAGWTDDQIREQATFTDGRIVLIGNKVMRRPKKRADYLLRYRRDFVLAVVEAKASYRNAGDGLQQAKEYAQILGLSFSYSTNGHAIIEHDFLTGLEREVASFPGPEELWQRLAESEGITNEMRAKLMVPFNLSSNKQPRYYQQIAINRSVQAILQGRRRILLTMATGTGKTDVAFQICWKLWSARWNRAGEYRKPKILFLADRNILVDDPKDKTFDPFGDARTKIEGEVVKSRELYFATYQAIARDERRLGLYREYSPEFFDLVIVDECHRGSARDDSNWREILEYFEPAYQVGMTATPLRDDNRDTYRYFGDPLYTYSLRQGIDDGFLAPYRVQRVITDVDASGWRPDRGLVDRYGQEIPDAEYTTPDFERILSLRARTEAVARHLTDHLRKTDRFAKTIVFCVDQEHAEEMRRALNNLNNDLVQQYPDYVVRVVSDEGQIGRGYLSRFQELETPTPVIVTTSQMLTTGVDVPTCKNVVLFRVVNAMTEFKQIIGRGTRVREDYGKLCFTIFDYTGSATRLFADPDFDGEPIQVTEEAMAEDGTTVLGTETVIEDPTAAGYAQEPGSGEETSVVINGEEKRARKYYVDGGEVQVIADLVYQLDADGKQLRVVKYTDYTADKVRTIARSAAELRARWTVPTERAAVLQALEERGISFEQLAEATGQTESDPFDLLCHVAFAVPLLTRRQRADRLRKEQQSIFDQYGAEARAILEELLDKYAQYGPEQLTDINVFKVDPLRRHGNILEIARKFGGPEKFYEAMQALQTHLYTA